MQALHAEGLIGQVFAGRRPLARRWIGVRGRGLTSSVSRSTVAPIDGLRPRCRKVGLMEAGKDWKLTTRYTCPQCGKHYIIPDWKQNPKCRVCDVELRADDHQGPKPIGS